MEGGLARMRQPPRNLPQRVPSGDPGVEASAQDSLAVERPPEEVRYGRPVPTYAQMSADTFLARLCALVPPPQAHTVLYYGVLSAHHKLRSAIVPRADEPEPRPSSCPSSSLAANSSSPPSPPCCTLSSAMLPLLACRG